MADDKSTPPEPDQIPQVFHDNEPLKWNNGGLWPRNHKGQYLSMKVGRNNSCHCASGKKFKVCCGSNTKKTL